MMSIRPGTFAKYACLVATLFVSAGDCRRRSPTEADGVASPRAVTPKLRPSPPARALSDAFADVAQAIRPSVVRLDVETIGRPSADGTSADDEDDGPLVPVRGTGSGVILDAGGHILTSSHVARAARKLTIRLADGRSYPGKVVGTDPVADVAVVAFDAPPPNLVGARLGDSDKLRIGEWAIAVGSPLGMDQTVTAGIISGTGRTGGSFRFESGGQVRSYIQTDAEINPGSSGGPLVTLEGEVIGLATVINVGPGGSYGFAIPIKQASAVARALIRGDRLRYPHIGVSVVSAAEFPRAILDHLDERLPDEGALVASIMPGGPAARAGLKPGDVITGIGGHPVRSAADVITSVSEQRIGAKLALEYVRDGTPHSADVIVAEYPTVGRG